MKEDIMVDRLTSKQRLTKVDELVAFIASGGDAKEMMRQWHPEDAILINDQAFAKLWDSGIYSVQQADADCLPLLIQCSPEFVEARKEMSQSFMRAFEIWMMEEDDVI